MAPEAGVDVEVAAAVALAVGVAPEPERHRGHGARQHELADLADELPALGVQGAHVGPQVPALELAGVDREEWVRPHEGGAEVRPPAHRAEPDVRADGLVDPGEALGRERRAGGADGPQAREVADLGRPDPGLHAGVEEGGAGAERGDAELGGEAPERGEVGVRGAPVVEHDARAEGEPAEEEVPHHPAGRREPEEALAGPDVVVERQGLQVLEEDPAVPLHDRLRQARRARGVEDPERVREGDPREGGLGRLGQELGPGHRGREARHGPRRGDGVLAQGGDEHEALEPRERYRGLRRVGQDRRHPVPGPHAETPEPRGGPGRRVGELGPGELDPRAVLAPEHEGRTVVGLAQEVLGVVQAELGEPPRARHPALGEDRLRRALGADVEPLQDGAPEALQVPDRPPPRRVVVGELEAAGLAEPGEVPGHRRALDELGRRGPEQLALAHHQPRTAAPTVRRPPAGRGTGRSPGAGSRSCPRRSPGSWRPGSSGPRASPR
ncbi:hypothetical protein HRbin12_01298 [bacterium HR12]|nr:hypothetical protein HRbin12_01298 [bacterium HR12]